MIDKGVSCKKKYLIDTNIVIYTLKGEKEAIDAMEAFENESIEI